MSARVEAAGSIGTEEVRRAVLANRRGTKAGILTHGATLQYLQAPDGTHLALGFDTVEEYAAKPGSFGQTVGRFGNRISEGRFSLDGKTYQLAKNQGGVHHLHGGNRGFGKRPWAAEVDDARNAATFTLHSKDGDENYPGALDATCTYELTEDDVLRIEMVATTDAPTPINLVHHTYWTMTGSGSIDAQRLELAAESYLETDDQGIPTGRILPVAQGAFDFRSLRRLDHAGPPEIDHCFVVSGGTGMRRVALLEDPASGRALELYANQPGVQVYSAIKVDTGGRDGTHYGPRCGLCLETEAFPDAPNHPEFPSCILRPGETYRHVMEHRFRLPQG